TPAPTPAPAAAQPPQMQPDEDEDFSGLLACFLDVGQGDCLFFIGPDGKTLLIDAGPPGSFETIRAHFDAWGVERLDVMIATHLHEDHIGGMAEILAHYETGAFYMPPYDYESSAYAALLAALEEADVEPRTLYADASTFIDWSAGTELRVLSPFQAPYTDYNDTSFILRLSYGDTALLLTGDAGELAERFMIKAFHNQLLRADILKVGHHGSDSATSEKLLSAVQPSIAVVSVGADNGYGLPDEAVLARLEARGVAVYRTDRSGSLCFALDGTRVRMIE
ncbi:MAG: ComEC/Rec2 family competence protein, partial [Clostridia bacterium]|nr:ComEC/Rec2 family competence protein [Clostridia bacterium]